MKIGDTRNNSVGPAKAGAPDKGGGAIWAVSADRDLLERICKVLGPLRVILKEICPKSKEGKVFWGRRQGPDPALIVLDVDNDMEWGKCAILEIKDMRLNVPLVVLTADFSRDFGAKIISQGVRYHFSRDFAQNEFLEVVRNLLG